MTVLTREDEYFRWITRESRGSRLHGRKMEHRNLDAAKHHAAGWTKINGGQICVVAAECTVWSGLREQLIGPHRRVIAVYLNGRKWDSGW